MESKQQQVQENLFYKKEWLQQEQIQLQHGLARQWVSVENFSDDNFEDVQCNNCQKIIWQPKFCGCGFQYCQQCIVNQENQYKCINDECEQYTETKNLKIPKKLDKLHFYCPFKELGCFEDKLPYQHFLQHIQSCQYRLNPQLTKYKHVTIIDHEIKADDTIGSYTAYYVCVKLEKEGTIQIERRYSDFNDFYWYLSNNYRNLPIPVIPSKQHSVNSMSDEVIQSRQQNLEIFLQLIAEIQEIEDDPVVLNFMTHQYYELQNELGIISDIKVQADKFTKKSKKIISFLWKKVKEINSNDNMLPDNLSNLQTMTQSQLQKKQKDVLMVYIQQQNFQTDFGSLNVIQQIYELLDDKISEEEIQLYKNYLKINKFTNISQKLFQFIESDLKKYQYVEDSYIKLNKYYVVNKNNNNDNNNNDYDYDVENDNKFKDADQINEDGNEIIDIVDDEDDGIEKVQPEDQKNLKINYKLSKSLYSLDFIKSVIDRQVKFYDAKSENLQQYGLKVIKFQIRSKSIQNCQNNILLQLQEIKDLDNKIYNMGNNQFTEKQEAHKQKQEFIQKYKISVSKQLENSDKLQKRLYADILTLQQQAKTIVKEYFINQPKQQYQNI